MKPGFLVTGLLSVAVLQGCLADLYGGDPRVQVRSRVGGAKVVDLRLGDLQRPGWSREFEPQVDSGGLSEVVELPAAGELRMGARIAGPGLDTVIGFSRRISVGEFCQVEIFRDGEGRIRVKD